MERQRLGAADRRQCRCAPLQYSRPRPDHASIARLSNHHHVSDNHDSVDDVVCYGWTSAASTGGAKTHFILITKLIHAMPITPPQASATREHKIKPSQPTTLRATSIPARPRLTPYLQGHAAFLFHSLSQCRGPAYAREPLPLALGLVQWPPSSSFVRWAACFSAGTLVSIRGREEG